MEKSVCVLAVFALGLIMGCNSASNENKGEPSVKQTRDINSVKDAYTEELMKIPGVVGIYVGELDDGTPCISVMVEKKTPDIEQKIPKKLEGYIVLVEETGKIELR